MRIFLIALPFILPSFAHASTVKVTCGYAGQGNLESIPNTINATISNLAKNNIVLSVSAPSVAPAGQYPNGQGRNDTGWPAYGCVTVAYTAQTTPVSPQDHFGLLCGYSGSGDLADISSSINSSLVTISKTHMIVSVSAPSMAPAGKEPNGTGFNESGWPAYGCVTADYK
jgi:hypothetical protein